MGKIREMENLAKSPGVKMAVVQVKYGESLKKAWNRHLTENPGDASVMIKIFNQPGPVTICSWYHFPRFNSR